MDIPDRMQSYMVEKKPCESSTAVLWLSPQWLPCCSIVLSCGWMRQRAAQRRLCYVVHAAWAPASLCVGDTPAARRAHCCPRVSIDPANHLMQCFINAPARPTPTWSSPECVCSTGNTDVKHRLNAAKYNEVDFFYISLQSLFDYMYRNIS